MKKVILFLAVLLMTAWVITPSHAQLINHKRRAEQAAGGAATKPGAKDAAVPAAPSWMQNAPRVTSKDEEKYDINRDGILQSAEVKILLRDIIQTVDAKGGMTITSGVAKLYDKNSDGLINRYEVADIKTDVQN